MPPILRPFFTTLILVLCRLLALLTALHARQQVFASAVGLNELERIRAYHERNYTWPPLEEEFIPNTNGWRRIMQRRLEQVQRIENRGDMYNGEIMFFHLNYTCILGFHYSCKTNSSLNSFCSRIMHGLHLIFLFANVISMGERCSHCFLMPKFYGVWMGSHQSTSGIHNEYSFIPIMSQF